MGIHFPDFKSVPDAWKDAVWNELRKQNKENADVHNSRAARERKRIPKVALAKAETLPRFTTRVGWIVHQFRHRLCDGDNAVTKELQDSLVEHGVIKDDTLQEIEPPIKRQTKIPKTEIERTVITITEL